MERKREVFFDAYCMFSFPPLCQRKSCGVVSTWGDYKHGVDSQQGGRVQGALWGSSGQQTPRCAQSGASGRQGAGATEVVLLGQMKKH